RKATAKEIANKYEDKYSNIEGVNISSTRVAANLRQFVKLQLLKKEGKTYEITSKFFERLTGGD
ncbi:MAG: hypothetical protein ACFFG0_25165, partial [Candidatus Thorarchaeota archaeon]